MFFHVLLLLQVLFRNYSNKQICQILQNLQNLSIVDKVTIGTCNLVSVIANFAEFPALDKIQSSIEFSSRKTLQFIIKLLMISKNC